MSYLQVVRDRDFAKLWTSQILSLIAQNLLNFALIIRIFDLTQGGRFANIAVALLILAIGIPAVLLSSLAGAYVDYWDRKRVLIVSNFVRTVLVLGFLLYEKNLVVVLLLAFLISSATQFFAPAEAASIPIVSRPKNLVMANGLFVTTFYATFIVGYASSAPVIKAFGSEAPYLLASGFFGIATLMAIFLPRLGGSRSRKLKLGELWRSTRKGLRQGRKIILSDPGLRYPIIQLMFVQGVISIILTLAPAISLALFHQSLKEASLYLVLPAGIGMLLGVLLVGYLTKYISKPVLVKVGLFGAGLSLVLLGLAGSLYRVVAGHPLATPLEVERLVAVILFVLGVAVAVISVAAQTLLHEMSQEDMRGTIFGVLYSLINLAATAPVLLAGFLASWLSVTKVIGLTGLIVILFAMWQAYSGFSHQSAVAAKR